MMVLDQYGAVLVGSCLLVLCQYILVLLGIKWNWVNTRLFACIYWKSGDLVGCHHSRTDDVKERCSNSADGPWTAEMSKYLTSTFEPYLIYSRVICKSIPAEIVWMQQLPGKSIELSTYLSVRYPQKNSYWWANKFVSLSWFYLDLGHELKQGGVVWHLNTFKYIEDDLGFWNRRRAISPKVCFIHSSLWLESFFSPT